jgi:GTP-binding protein
VGLVGLPNAGKSTLVSRISAARPKIAAYPFTTLVPNLGVVDWAEHRSFVVADIPGLIEGSHLGEGLGDQFLRHVQRTSVILHLVDVSDLAEEPDAAIATIEAELAAFDASLLQRPRILVATKTDASTDRGRIEKVRAAAASRGLDVLAISAVSGDGLPQLVRHAGELVAADQAARAAAAQESP